MPVLDFDQPGLGADIQPPVCGGTLDVPDTPIVPLLPRGQPTDSPGLDYARVRGYDDLGRVAGVTQPQPFAPSLLQGLMSVAGYLRQSVHDHLPEWNHL